MTETTPPPSRNRSRLLLLLIVGVFALPILAALMLNRAGWMPGHSKNFGEVVNPPLPLRDIEFVHAEGTRTRLANTQERWTLLVRFPPGCDAACRDRIALLAKVRTSLGRNAGKLEVLVLQSSPPPAGHPTPGGLAFAAPATPLPGPMAAPLTAGPELWLVNPYGLAEMRYPPGFVPAELRKDLGKLVR